MQSSTAEIPTIIVPATYGTPFEGGFYGGQVRIRDERFAVAWAPKEFGTTRKIWLPGYDDVPNATSCFDSMANTIAMAESGSPLAQWALALDINGKKDWCIPARDVLELGYRHLKPGGEENSASFRDGDNPSSIPAGYPYTEAFPAQTIADAFRSGGPEAFDEEWHWSSTQYSADDAWGQDFSDGTTDDGYEKFEAVGRACRLIQLNP